VEKSHQESSDPSYCWPSTTPLTRVSYLHILVVHRAKNIISPIILWPFHCLSRLSIVLTTPSISLCRRPFRKKGAQCIKIIQWHKSTLARTVCFITSFLLQCNIETHWTAFNPPLAGCAHFPLLWVEIDSTILQIFWKIILFSFSNWLYITENEWE
jgi:hypothetical protein